MSRRPENSFTTLSERVPVHYDRSSGSGLGTRGTPRKWYCTADFEKKLDNCFAELWSKCPLGKAEVICTAGA